MTWTTDKPTTPGWYWWRFNKCRPMILDIMERYGELYDENGKRFVDDMMDTCEWAGPLEPPQ